MTQTTMTVGVIGIGVMGSAIAARLLAQGGEVHVHDRDPAKSAGLAAAGAVVHPTPASLTTAVDTVILSLNLAAIVEEVVFGAAGVAEAASADKLLIDMSSIDPDATADMARRLDEIGGMGWVDSPLSGGAPAALSGTLTLMLGGRDADVERARTILCHLAANMTHMGGQGAGQATKLINQVLCACTFLAVAEATNLALAAGVDAARIPAALANGRADSRILQEFMPKMAAFDETPTGRIDNMLKDLEAVQRVAARLRAPMPLTGLITELHRMLVAGGIGAEDSVAYMKLFDFGRASAARRPLP
jgi:2-hydroxy-3-oxopropionate reductase